MADRMKPVEAAKKLNIPPQRVYNLIKQGRIKTFPNPSGKVALVDFGEVKIILSQVKQRGPRKEKGRGGSALPGIRRGSILTHDKFPVKGAFARPDGGGKSVRTVTETPRVNSTLVWLSDGTIETFWSVESLSEKLQKHSAQIEHPDALLGMIAFQWRQAEETSAWAEKLETFLRTEEIPYKAINVGTKHQEEEEEEQKDDKEGSQHWKEIEIPEEGLDLSKVTL